MSALQSPAMALCLALLNSGQSRQAIAEAIGYSRPAVSRYLLGTYGEVREIEAAILNAFLVRECPHTGEVVTPELCKKKALAPRPFGGAARLAWWSACQVCPHKPKGVNHEG